MKNALRNTEIIERYCHGESYGKIAASMGISRNAVAGVVDRHIHHLSLGRSRAGKTIPLTGQSFGRLRVVSQEGRASNGSVRWVCICECGATITTNSYSLRRGFAKSCGCLRKEHARIASLNRAPSNLYGASR